MKTTTKVAEELQNKPDGLSNKIAARSRVGYNNTVEVKAAPPFKAQILQEECRVYSINARTQCVYLSTSTVSLASSFSCMMEAREKNGFDFNRFNGER